MSKLRGRNWAFVMYPESMPSDWFERLQMTGLPFAISPLHDQDLNPTGEVKKSHYHVITYYENPTTQDSVKTQVTDLVCGTIPIKLESLKGMFRYHIHRDNPEKYQYNDSDRTFINGFDIKRVDDLSYYETKMLLRQLFSIVVDNHLLEYCDLIDLLRENELFDLLDVAENHTLVLTAYITSRRYKTKKEKFMNKS